MSRVFVFGEGVEPFMPCEGRRFLKALCLPIPPPERANESSAQ